MRTQLYISLALVDAQHLATIDYNTGTIDTYTLGTNGGISLLKSVPGQLGDSADSIAVSNNYRGSYVFTGNAVPGASQVQGGSYNVRTGDISFLSGSPATDPNGINGAAITYDGIHNLIIQGEQQSSSLGVYVVTGFNAPKLSFKTHVPLAQTNVSPTAFAQSYNTLFVDGDNNGDIEACRLGGSAGVSNCATIATLPYAQGYSQGIAVLNMF